MVKKVRRARSIGLAVLAGIAAAMARAPLLAGTVVLARSTSSATSGAPPGSFNAVRRNGHIYIQDGNLRMEWGGLGPSHTLIYRGRTGTTWVLDELHRGYLEADRGALERSGEAGVPPHLTYRQVASGVRVNGFATDRYEALAGGEKVKDLWIAPAAALKLGAADLAALGALGRAAGESSAAGAWSFTAGEGGPPGVVVRLFRYENGKRVWSSEVTGVLQQTLPPGLFLPPKGYRKQTVAR
jgi:hypothetical protein